MTQKTRSRSRRRRSSGAPSDQGDRNRSDRKSRPKGGTRGKGGSKANGHGRRDGNPQGNVFYRQPMDGGRGSRVIVAKFDDLFAQQSAAVRAIAARLREIVMEVLPDAEERVHVALKIALYHQPTEVCGIQPVNKYCNLFFSNGGRMNDPDGLLEGAGPVRHVKVRSAVDIPVEGLKALILEAKKLVR